MLETVGKKTGGVVHVGSGYGLGKLGVWALESWTGAKLDEAAAMLIEGAVIYVWLEWLRPLVDALFARAIRWARGGAGPVALLLLGLWSANAEATDIAIGIRCEEGQTFTSSIAGSEIDGCLHHDVVLDVVIGAQVIGVQLTGGRPKVVSAGVSPSFGLKLVYQPKDFKLPEMIGGVLTLAGNLLDLAGRAALTETFEGWLLGGITVLGFWSVSVGWRFVFAEVNSADLVMTSGFTIPI